VTELKRARCTAAVPDCVYPMAEKGMTQRPSSHSWRTSTSAAHQSRGSVSQGGTAGRRPATQAEAAPAAPKGTAAASTVSG